MLRGGLAKFQRKLSEVGFGHTLFILLKSILPERILSFSSLHIRQRVYGPSQGTRDPELSFRPITTQDQAALSEFDEYANDVAQKLADGTLGFVLEKDGEIVSSNWFTRRDQTMFGWMVLKPPEDSIISVFNTVPPRHRGNRYHRRMKECTADTFSRQGIARQISFIESWNRNSLRAANSAGGSTIARLFYLRLFHWKLVRYKGTWRFGRWSEDSPLVLEI